MVLLRGVRVERESRHIEKLHPERLRKHGKRVNRLRKRKPDKHAALWPGPADAGVFRHEFRKRLLHIERMLAVDRADFREMRLQKAACEHSGSDELIDAGSGEDSVALDLREHLNHVTRRDDVAKAKTRGEDLREGAEADRAVRRQIPDGDRRLLFV